MRGRKGETRGAAQATEPPRCGAVQHASQRNACVTQATADRVARGGLAATVPISRRTRAQGMKYAGVHTSFNGSGG